MSTWNRSICDESGPNPGIYYGSLILSVLIIYAALRTAFVYFKNSILKAYNRVVSEDESRVSYLQRIWIDAWSCTPDPAVAPLLYVIGVVAFFALLSIALGASAGGRRDGSSHIWYMICGVIVAWLYECLFKTIFYPIKMEMPQKDAKHDAVVKNGLLLRAGRIFLLPVVDFDRDWSSTVGKSESAFESSILWRFLPDGLFVINGIVLSAIGKLQNKSTAPPFRWIVVQFTSSLFIVVSLLQRGESRNNISRFLLETPFLNVVGKSSFFVYLLQTAAFNFYARVIYDATNSHSFPLPKENSVYVLSMWSFAWYRQFPVGPKIAGFLCLTAISWFLQTYYQDMFVSSLANKLLSRYQASHGKKKALILHNED